MIEIFERQLLPGWVYPCTVEDIRHQLTTLPAEDLEGLGSVGLIPSTRKNCSANGRYWGGLPPTRISLYSYHESLRYKQPAGTRPGDLDWGLSVEREFGMHVEKVGSRWFCQWSAENLRLFILEHVLIHEVGHHVQHMQRRRAGLWSDPGRQVKEQFAEAYACRYVRDRQRR
jgi:hypothetical protein